MIFLLLLIGSCSQPERTLSSTIRLGILPDRDPQDIVNLYRPLQDYLKEQLNVDVELVLASDYGDLLNKFTSNKLDLVNFGALTYVQAQAEVPAIPLVMRDVDTRFTSYFIVPINSTYQTLPDTQSKHLLFGSDLSTSGHMMPRFFLLQQQINPEEYFSKVTYSGKHDATIEMIANQEADVGAVNAILYDRLKSLDDDRVANTRIVWETPPYTDYVWTMHEGYDEETYQRISQAFLSLNYENPTNQIIMDNLGTKGFLPANDSDYSDIRMMANSMGLINTQDD